MTTISVMNSTIRKKKKEGREDNWGGKKKEGIKKREKR